MRDFLTEYENRVKLDGGNTADSIRNNTNFYINSKFKDSTTYRLAKFYHDKGLDTEISGEVDLRVIAIDRMGTIRNLLFRPQVEYPLGTIFSFDNNDWITYDSYGSAVDNVKLRVNKINDKIRWIDKDKNKYELPCVSSNSYLGSQAKIGDNGLEYNTYSVRLEKGQILVFAQYTKATKKIDVGNRFLFNSKAYKVIHIDDIGSITDGVGTLQLLMEITEKNINDDFKTMIAHNEYNKDIDDETEEGEW